MSRLDALQRVVERAIGTQTPGLVVVVAANERLECVAGGAGITPDTRFPIGCIIKHLTAVSLLHHVERGSLSLDAAVSKILPELATNRRESSPITIRHLMSHNGGFIDPGEEGRWSMTWPQFADWFRDREQVYPPGAVWSYSQAGHVILSKVLEKLEEKDYAHAIEQAS